MKFKGLIGFCLFCVFAFYNLNLSYAELAEGVTIAQTDKMATSAALDVSDLNIGDNEGAKVEAYANISKYNAGVKGGYIYFDKSKGTITDCDQKVTSVIIPDEIDGVAVTSIGDSAFKNCSSLINITISSSVTSIGGWAFNGCSGLTGITIPGSVKSIGDTAFNGCSSLAGITISCSVKSIGYTVFNGCSSLTNVTIPSSVVSIGDWAFNGCSSLTRIKIPSDVTSISNSAFSGCDNLTIVCKSGSYAEAFAKKSGISCEALEEDYIFGDANDDGSLVADDAASVLQKVLNNSFELKLQNDTDNWFAIIDVDCDGQLAAADAAVVLQKVLNNSFIMECEKQQ